MNDLSGKKGKKKETGIIHRKNEDADSHPNHMGCRKGRDVKLRVGKINHKIRARSWMT